MTVTVICVLLIIMNILVSPSAFSVPNLENLLFVHTMFFLYSIYESFDTVLLIWATSLLHHIAALKSSIKGMPFLQSMTRSTNFCDKVYIPVEIFEGPFSATPKTIKNQDVLKIKNDKENSRNFRMP